MLNSCLNYSSSDECSTKMLHHELLASVIFGGQNNVCALYKILNHSIIVVVLKWKDVELILPIPSTIQRCCSLSGMCSQVNLHWKSLNAYKFFAIAAVFWPALSSGSLDILGAHFSFEMAQWKWNWALDLSLFFFFFKAHLDIRVSPHPTHELIIKNTTPAFGAFWFISPLWELWLTLVT